MHSIFKLAYLKQQRIFQIKWNKFVKVCPKCVMCLNNSSKPKLSSDMKPEPRRVPSSRTYLSRNSTDLCYYPSAHLVCAVL